MDAYPNEILDLISAEACTDDGLTGRSLSLVSRRIRDVSRRHALQFQTHTILLFDRYDQQTLCNALNVPPQTP